MHFSIVILNSNMKKKRKFKLESTGSALTLSLCLLYSYFINIFIKKYKNNFQNTIKHLFMMPTRRRVAKSFSIKYENKNKTKTIISRPVDQFASSKTKTKQRQTKQNN